MAETTVAAVVEFDDSLPLVHACPGGCGTQVRKAELACGSCWSLLPALLREEIRRLDSSDRMAQLGVIGDALIWFRSNVEGGEFVGD